MRTRTIILVAILICSCSKDAPNSITDPGSVAHATTLQGSVSGILTKDSSPYNVIADITVESNDSLLIEPGVKILFFDSTALFVFGQITSVGEQERPITFTAFNHAWFGINIDESSGDNQFRYCEISKIETPYHSTPEKGSVTLRNSRVSITNCIIKNNRADDGGALSSTGSEVTLMNNILMDNQATSFAGAILSRSSVSTILNNTIYRNSSSNYGGAIVIIDPVGEEIQNNIIHSNSSTSGDSRIAIFAGDASLVIVNFNFLGTDDLDPDFVSASDVRLLPYSPCIDQGNPASEYNDVDGSLNDQGAFGGPLGDWRGFGLRDVAAD